MHTLLAEECHAHCATESSPFPSVSFCSRNLAFLDPHCPKLIRQQEEHTHIACSVSWHLDHALESGR